MEENNLLVLKMTVREAQGIASISNHRVDIMLSVLSLLILL